jgi:NAD(P)-dependent dehydrogenase (short-subunit alcohol dehydrogenase family)
MSTLDLFSLQGKTVVVTGACGLLGRYHCQALADAGATVVATDLDQGQCNQMARALEAGLGFAADVTNPESVRHLLAFVLEHTGRIDVLVNNAAINDRFEHPEAALELSKFENYPLALWKRSLEVNITGVFICSQVLGTKMAEAGRGSIINIASTYGIVAPDQSLYHDTQGRPRFYKSAVYPTTKGAVLAFTRFLAAYWGKAGVRVNALSPGGVENAQDEFFVNEYARRTPLGRMASPDDYRGALLFLASEASSYITGANLVVDGGFTIW